METKVLIQGYYGSFHDAAAERYFGRKVITSIPMITFEKLAQTLDSDASIDFGVMAIENSIAGSILQNYRILREYRLRIVGETYLRIKHNLMALPGQTLNEIKEVRSHPMALNQCLRFLHRHPHLALVETDDTARSAWEIKEKKLMGTAGIASEEAARKFGLQILEEGIETSPVNYTRFFIIQDDTKPIPSGIFDKASIYIRVYHEKGSLLKVLETIYKYGINLSKLQSYPVEGKVSEYFFHLDLEFEDMRSYESLIGELNHVTAALEILGVYKKDVLEFT